jgi:hypothetical protein
MIAWSRRHWVRPAEHNKTVITILDRPGLEAVACECYRIIEAEYGRLIGCCVIHPLLSICRHAGISLVEMTKSSCGRALTAARASW